MSSKAIESLDAWLLRAEEVLAEQREKCISPSLGLAPGDGWEEWTITLLALLSGLEGLLESLCSRPGRWILIVESDERRYQFWQALAFEDGALVTEVVANDYLPKEHHWSTAQEQRLLELGWGRQTRPFPTNFIAVEATTSPVIGPVVERAAATFSELFNLDGDDNVFVKMFPSAIRGNTPASPEYMEYDEENDPLVCYDDLTEEERETRDAAYVCNYPAGPEIELSLTLDVSNDGLH
jgi:hypothetical protein